MRAHLNPLLASLTAYMQEAMNRTRAEAQASGKPVFDFGIGDPREPTPAFIREALKAAVPEVSQYPSVTGLPKLRASVAAYLARRFELTLDPAREIIPCSGAKEALFHLPLAFVSKERPICFHPDPAYPVYERAILFAGGEPRTLAHRAENGFVPDLDAIPAETWRRTAIVFDNFPHNPTGTAAPRAHHEKLFALARDFGFVVACDEPYVDLYDPAKGAPHSGLQVSRENVLAVHSLSKRSGMTGYRSGFIAGEPWLIDVLKETRANFGVASASFVQEAAAVAWADDAHVIERRDIFLRKRAILRAHLDRIGLQVRGDGAFYLWVRVPAGHDSVSYATHLARSGVLVAAGTFFGAEGEGFVRLAMVPTIEECRRAVEAWPA